MELAYPEIVAPAEPPKVQTAVATATRAALDLKKIDLADVALAQFGDWRADVAKATATLKDVPWDVSTAAGLADIISVRQRVTKAPQAEANKIADALVSKLTKVNKQVRAEQVLIVDAYKALGAPLTKIIDDREAELKRLAEAEAARKKKHTDAIATIVGYAEQGRGKDSATLAKGIAYVETIDVSEAVFEEYVPAAQVAKERTLEKLRELHTKALAAEAEAAELVRRKAEADRVAAEQKVEAERLATMARQLAEAQANLRRQAEEIEAARQRAITPAAPVATEGTADTPELGTLEAAPNNDTPEQDSQHVLKAEAARPDATDRETPAHASPVGGPMGAGQPAAAGPVEGEPPLYAPLRNIDREAIATERLLLAEALARRFGGCQIGPTRYAFDMGNLADLIDAARA